MIEIGSRWQNRNTAEVVTVRSTNGHYAVVSGEHGGEGRSEIGWEFLVNLDHFRLDGSGKYFPVR